MLNASSGLLRAGFALKSNQVKLAIRSYLRDRTNRATGTLTSYTVAAGLFVACGIFLLAAALVGADALFRWVEIKYGLFPAFGALAGPVAGAGGDLRWGGRGQTEAPAAAVSHTGQPPARRDQGQSGQAGPGRSRQGYGRRYSAGAIRARSIGSAATTTEYVSPRCLWKPQGSGRRRPPGGNLAGLGRRTPARSGPSNGRVMPGRQSQQTDNLLFIAATAFLILTAQRYFQFVPSQRTSPDTDSVALLAAGRVRARTIAARPR